MLIKEENAKVNFIDKNDVFIGYDLSQSCCEDAGYFISTNPDQKYSYDVRDQSSCSIDISATQGYVFDTNYFEEIESPDLDAGGQVCFKMVKDGEEPIYLHLYNSHNGYYGHGFTAKISGEAWQSDYL